MKITIAVSHQGLEIDRQAEFVVRSDTDDISVFERCQYSSNAYIREEEEEDEGVISASIPSPY